MKISLILFLLLFTYLNSLSQENVIMVDSANHSNVEEDTGYDETGNTETLDSLKSIMSNFAHESLVVQISFDGYESASDATWYYDSLAVIRCYHCTWDMEGTSGEDYYWYDNGKLSAIYQETQGQSDEQDITFLLRPRDAEKLKAFGNLFRDNEKHILKLMDENPDKKTVDEFSVTLNLEETVYYGFDFIQTTNIHIDKPLYELLTK